MLGWVLAFVSVALTGTLAGLVAEASTGAADPVSIFIGTGVAGAVVVLMLTGQLVPGRTHQRALDEADELKKEVMELHVEAARARDRYMEAAARFEETTREHQRVIVELVHRVP